VFPVAKANGPARYGPRLQERSLAHGYVDFEMDLTGPGDRVLVSCITACGRCRFCRERHDGLCTGGGGWVLGHLIDGTQAEYVRVPFADTSTHRKPDEVTDEAVLMLADIGPTGYEVGVLTCRATGTSVQRACPNETRCSEGSLAVSVASQRARLRTEGLEAVGDGLPRTSASARSACRT
jgi:hypothetical protein